MPIIRSPRLYLCYYLVWCVMPWLLVVGGQVQGSSLCVRNEGNCSSSFPHPGRIATKALHTICNNNTSIVSSSWWWAYKCPKYVEQFISAISHSVASSCFSSVRIYNDSRTNIHQTWLEFMHGSSLKINKCNKSVFLQTSNCRFVIWVSAHRKSMRSKRQRSYDADGELRPSTAVSLASVLWPCDQQQYKTLKSLYVTISISHLRVHVQGRVYT